MSYLYPGVEADYEWLEAPPRFCDFEPRMIRGRCRHRDVVPVESIVTGDELARLCLVCDTQLPAGWSGQPIRGVDFVHLDKKGRVIEG